MSNLTRAKIGLAVAGLLLFGAGVRFERSELRVAGIAFVVAAWVLRFVKQGGESQGAGTAE